MSEIERKALEEIGKDFEHQKHKISNLQHLNFIKKGNKENPQVKLQIKRLDKNICPLCLNRINWDKLYTIISLHNKMINYLNKELAEIILGSELDEEAELTEEEREAIQKGKQLIKLYKAEKLDKKGNKVKNYDN
ncbi:unnamed protein product [marine sediment metagenome]|uniref:Uncharacterized protein n=1 Tax=marine sediment metagenome TaxID=412755 RepID=X1IGK3_9ZZZZ